MDMSRFAPWNWFKKEQEAAPKQLPVETRPSGTALDPISRFHREVDQLFDDFFRAFGVHTPGLGPVLGSSRMNTLIRPSLDISATDKVYTISVELPGVEKDNVQVEVSGDALRIRGEKKQETRDEGRGYYSVERSYGSFQRVLALPEDADRNSIDASFKNGVMTITIPRCESAVSKAKRIEVKAA